jgi:hypothetical protein
MTYKMMAGMAVLAIGIALSAPARADDLRDLCPDRPGKGTSPCTVDAGHFQLETEFFNAAFQRQAGVTTETYVTANSLLKFGVTDNWDVEAGFAPYTWIRTHDENAGMRQNISGVGDLLLRTKYNLLGNGAGAFSIALDPFIKIPTARLGIGNHAVEGGLLVPMALDLGGDWSLGATPEIDSLKNNADSGRHVSLTGVVGIGRALGHGITLGAELWTSNNRDPMGTVRQYSVDLDIAWQPEGDGNIQYDAGINRGLNGSTPRWQGYFGVSRRF